MTVLLCEQAGSYQCLGTSASATPLRLHEQACSDQCFGTSASATALLLRELARSDQGFGTPPSSTTLRYVSRHVLISVSALMLLLRHFG